MGKAKKTRKFAVAKKVISPKDSRIKSNQKELAAKKLAAAKGSSGGGGGKPRHVDQAVSALFFQYNTQLGPPYHILVDTNFINFSIRNKMDVVRSMMDCLLAKCTPCITDCVMGELEKLGSKYKVSRNIHMFVSSFYRRGPSQRRCPCISRRWLCGWRRTRGSSGYRAGARGVTLTIVS